MASKKNHSVYEDMSFEEMTNIRDTIYQAIQIYNLTSRQIDTNLVEANEETAMQLFAHGLNLAIYLRDNEMDIDDEDIDSVQKCFSALQDELPSDQVSFIANHYQDCLSLYHFGFLFAKGSFQKEEPYEDCSPQVASETRELVKEVTDAHDQFMHDEETYFDRMMEVVLKDEVVLEYLETHKPEAYILIRKGRTWWKNGGHNPVDDLFKEDKELRNEYFRQVMLEGMLQNNVIIDDNRELGFLLFKLGALIADFNDKQK